MARFHSYSCTGERSLTIPERNRRPASEPQNSVFCCGAAVRLNKKGMEKEELKILQGQTLTIFRAAPKSGYPSLRLLRFQAYPGQEFDSVYFEIVPPSKVH